MHRPFPFTETSMVLSSSLARLATPQSILAVIHFDPFEVGQTWIKCDRSGALDYNEGDHEGAAREGRGCEEGGSARPRGTGEKGLALPRRLGGG